MEARKIRRSERGSRAFFGLLVGCWLVGCRCEPDQPAELALTIRYRGFHARRNPELHEVRDWALEE